jgi:hypothetical protein
MTRLRVDPAGLRDARARLGRLAHELETLHIGIWQVWDTVGGHALAGELEHFCGTWHGASSRLAGDVAGLARQLEAAASAYERIEHHVAGSSGHAGSLSGSVGGSGTTVIGGGSGPSSGSGTTVIGGGSGPSRGSTTTVIE